MSRLTRRTKFIARIIIHIHHTKHCSKFSHVYVYPNNRVASRRIAYPPKATAIWIKAVADTCRPAGGAILLAELTGERTRFPRLAVPLSRSCSTSISFFPLERERKHGPVRGGGGETSSLRLVARISTIYPVADCLRGNRG